LFLTCSEQKENILLLLAGLHSYAVFKRGSFVGPVLFGRANREKK